MSTFCIFNSSSWADLWGDAPRLRWCQVRAVQWGCWINYRPGSAWGRRRSTFCVWGLTTAAKPPSSTNSNRLMWVYYDGSSHEAVSDSLLAACFQPSNLLGPFSEEWKHVSQVKGVTLARALPLFTLLSSLVFSCGPCLCVWADRRRRKKSSRQLASTSRSSRAPGKINLHCVQCLSLAGSELIPRCSLSSLLHAACLLRCLTCQGRADTEIYGSITSSINLINRSLNTIWKALPELWLRLSPSEKATPSYSSLTAATNWGWLLPKRNSTLFSATKVQINCSFAANR